MYEDLRQEAENKVKAKTAFVICGIVFVCTTVVLVMLSLYLSSIAVWLLLPIPVMAMVLGIFYILTFGFSLSRPLSTAWREEEVERELEHLHRDELSAEDRLELEELERLKEKWE